MDQVISATISAHPVAISGVEKVPNCILATAKPSKSLKHKSYQRLCCTRLPYSLKNNGTLFLKNQICVVYALPLQAVTMDNDSEGSTSPGPPSSVEYAGIFQTDEGARRSLLYYIRVWYTNAKTQDVCLSFHQVLERSKTKLQTVDRSQILQQIKCSQLTKSGIQCWKSTQPWIKWPIAIFAPWFLFISIVYGPSTSMDLLPFWTIGPVCVSLAIRAHMQITALCSKWLADKKFVESLTAFMEGLQTGRLPRELVVIAKLRFEEAKSEGVKKTSELESFIQSREYKVVLGQYADEKFLELREVCIDKYEDWRLIYLYLERKVKNLI